MQLSQRSQTVFPADSVMTNLESYYGKFKEDHRLTTRHGTVEFTTSMKYIRQFLAEKKNPRILDVGAGTGRYSVALSREGYDVTAVEFVKHNLEILRAKHENVKSWQGNAVNLHFLEDSTFDVILLFGPLYHLPSAEEKRKALLEAKRVLKDDGVIFAAYIMNEYAVISYCFGEHKMKECMQEKRLTDDFHTVTASDDLYSYLRLEDIEELNKSTGLARVKVFAQDGPSDYMRRTLNAMDEETFSYFLQYHLATCERPELLGASSHVVDILCKTDSTKESALMQSEANDFSPKKFSS